MPLFLLLLIVPLVEIFLFIEVGGLIGVWPTIGIVILTALIGTAMLRRQGLAALRGVQSRLLAGEDPGRLLADGAMILFAGALLLTPGFLTDAVGFLLLVPAVRGWLWERLAPRLAVASVRGRRTRVATGRVSPGGTSRGHASQGHASRGRVWPGGDTVEGEYEVVDPEEAHGENRGGERGGGRGEEHDDVRPVGHDRR